MFLWILECARQHLLRLEHRKADAHPGDLPRGPAVPGERSEQFRWSPLSHLGCGDCPAFGLHLALITGRAVGTPVALRPSNAQDANEMQGTRCFLASHVVRASSGERPAHNSVE